MGRPKAFDRDEALDAAVGVFREHGYEGSSSEMLVGAMKIGRQSLYDTFGDKWRLYREAVDRYCTAETLAHREQLRRGPRAIGGLEAMIERVVVDAGRPCLGVGSIAEFGRSRADLNGVHEAADRALSSAIARRIRDAQAEGDVARTIDPAAAARFLIANIAGIRVAARGGAGPDQLQALGQLALRALR
jgi:AcrR family transcriptional regulator